MYYSVQLIDRIFVKGYIFLPFAKNMGRNIGKSINKNLQQMRLRLLQKYQFKEMQKQLVICFNNIADALAKSYNDKIKKVSKTYNKIIQRQLKMRMVKK